MVLLKRMKESSVYEQIKGLVNREIQKEQEVDEDVFFGTKKQDDDDGGGGFDYGRKTLKGPYEDEIRKDIPFKRLELFKLELTKNGIIGS